MIIQFFVDKPGKSALLNGPNVSVFAAAFK